MKLKKVLATGLSLLMAMGTIAGCGVSTDTGVNTNASSESGVAAAEKTDQKEESTTKTDGDVEEITWRQRKILSHWVIKMSSTDSTKIMRGFITVM